MIQRTPVYSGRVDRRPGVPCVIIAREMLDTTPSDTAAPPEERRGCLFALSQPPLLMASLHDLLLL
jgi:hypothetical protein